MTSRLISLAAVVLLSRSYGQSLIEQKIQQPVELSEKPGMDSSKWAELMMRADDVAVQLQRTTTGGCCGYRCLRVDKHHVLTFRWNGITLAEDYQHDLLKEVVTWQSGTAAGAKALIRLLQPGCGVMANEWEPYFKTVLNIVDTPRWRKVPDAGLLRIQAEAYETWWSLSKASPSEPGLADSAIGPSDFADGAENARLQSIAAYKALVAIAPIDQDAVERLHELEAGRDTTQRNWVCFGD